MATSSFQAAKAGASSSSAAWQNTFEALFKQGAERFSEGTRGATRIFTPEEIQQLEAIGFRAQEIYDFVEDHINYGEPFLKTILAVQAVRHEYFVKEQGGVLPADRFRVADFPAKTDAVEGISWLPRLIMKARAKLRGQLPDELMYGCGGDRHFFAEHRLDPAALLRKVWNAGDNSAAIVQYVKDPASR
ncbi:MAG: DUF5069 domain-containing protein [Candidatus Methylacidiphilales bacterium]|nr:DUF5069 domain-containing protein [Candidatus Methylacidiphilales bacterium]